MDEMIKCEIALNRKIAKAAGLKFDRTVADFNTSILPKAKPRARLSP